MGWTTEADLLDGQRTDIEEVSSIINDPNARLLLATTDQGIAGCILIRRELEGAYVGVVAVSPDLQELGIGKRLLGEAERRSAIEFGARRWRKTVIEQRTELVVWYVRHGYIVSGRTEPFPYGNSRFGIPRRDDLRFMVLEKSVVPPHQKSCCGNDGSQFGPRRGVPLDPRPSPDGRWESELVFPFPNERRGWGMRVTSHLV